MFWKASSTLLASSAEVSIKERLFSPAAYHQHRSTKILRRRRLSHTCKLLGLLCWHSPQMPQIALVSYQHDDNVRVRVVPQLLQPPGHILVRLVLADIVDEQGADCPSIVGRGDGAVSFLSSSVPDLCLDRLCVYLDRPGCELYTDG
jgi:hypothetical protein